MKVKVYSERDGIDFEGRVLVVYFYCAGLMEYRMVYPGGLRVVMV